jgi:hypothetical protein
MNKDSDLDNIRAEPKYAEIAGRAARQALQKKEQTQKQAQGAAK